MSERDQFYQGVVAKGISENEKQSILNEKKASYEQYASLLDHEKEKTPEELAVIDMVRNYGDKLTETLGLEPFNVSSGHFHIIHTDEWPSDFEAFGQFMPRVQQIIIQEQETLTALAVRAYHEYMHMKSYGMLQVVNLPEGHHLSNGETSYHNSYRVGFMVKSRDGSNEYFRLIEEAITEELTRSFATYALPNSPIFNEESATTEGLKEKYGNVVDSEGKRLATSETYNISEDETHISSTDFSYKTERVSLNLIINKLAASNPELEPNDVYWMFVRGKMIGDILPIGRLIDKTFGVGTFRKIGEIEDPAALLAYAKSL